MAQMFLMQFIDIGVFICISFLVGDKISENDSEYEKLMEDKERQERER